MSRIAIDFDGTLVTKNWPDIGEWYPGAIDAMRKLREAGHHPYLYTARTAPTWPDGSPRGMADVMRDEDAVRRHLESAGLPWLDLWTGEGKPHWDLLVDDKALWFPGRPNSWKKITPVILKRVGDEDSFAAIMAEAGRREEPE